MNILNIFLFLSFFVTTTASATKPEVTISHHDALTSNIAITLDVQPGEFIYRDYLDVSVDRPDVALTWESNTDTVTHYDPTFKEDKKIFKDSVTITCNATRNHDGIDHANIHIAYYLNTNKAITETVIPVSFVKPAADLAYAIDAQDAEIETASAQDNPKPAPSAPAKKTLSSYVSDLASSTQSPWIRLVLVFLLGVLLSLTPCIYPMIPITVGILQSHGSKSIWSNFLVSLAYVTGIATTFAILGLLAAFTGQMFGTFMANPFVVLVIVALLLYLAFSMFGFYEMYIPKSLQGGSGATLKSGSFISLFLFGLVSGSVASPCLSPGLVLLLSIVTTLSSKLLGFALLFSFGIGLGMPLLIIGTFSGSINMLPKAGMWMIEIKKIFGIILIYMCFYFLNTILPWHLLLGLMAITTFVIGVYILRDARKTQSSAWRLIKNILGMGAIAGSVVILAQAYKAVYTVPVKSETDRLWMSDYDKALSTAQEANKKMFVDIGAEYCSICKAIDKKVFKDPAVLAALEECVISVKLDGANTADAACERLKEKHKILGFPTYLLVDPITEEVIKQWGAELYETECAEFIKEIQSCVEKKIQQ